MKIYENQKLNGNYCQSCKTKDGSFKNIEDQCKSLTSMQILENKENQRDSMTTSKKQEKPYKSKIIANTNEIDNYQWKSFKSKHNSIEQIL